MSMSCGAKGEYLNISMNNASEELVRMEIGYSQILNLIEYLHTVRDSMIETQDLPNHVRDNRFPGQGTPQKAPPVYQQRTGGAF